MPPVSACSPACGKSSTGCWAEPAATFSRKARWRGGRTGWRRPDRLHPEWTMPTRPPWPDPHLYEPGQLCGLEAGQLDVLFGHLETCAACQGVVRALPEDPLAALLRARPAELEPVPHLVERVQQLLTSSLPDSTPTPADPTPPGRPPQPGPLDRLGPFRILGTLGTGGMGVVFRAEDPRLNRLVALKLMKP